MAPFKKNLVLYEGSGFFPERMRLSAGASKDALVPVDFTGCSAAMDIRADYNDPTPLMSLSTADGTLHLSADGWIEIDPTLAAVTSLTWDTGVYDIEITYPGRNRPRRLVMGSVKVSQEATWP